MTSSTELSADVSPELRSMSIGLLAGCPIVFAVAAALAYRPTFDGPWETTLAVLPLIMLATTLIALLAPLRSISVIVHRTAIAIAIGVWAILMFDSEAWMFYTFILFAVCFAAGQWLGVALSGLISVIWTLAWRASDQPDWVLPIPIGAFLVASLLAVTMWRIEGTKEVMRRNRELESAYLAQEVAIRQKDKLATLGKISAGMAHELNNPAAAAQQASRQLSLLWSNSELVDAELAGLGLTDPEVTAVRTFTARIEDRGHQTEFLDPLERSDRATEVQAYLERVGLDDAWEIAPSLVDLGLHPEELTELAAQVQSDRLAGALSLVAAQHNRAALLKSVDLSTGRITELVKALKTYTYLDQSPRQLVDVHEGLDSTLVILQSRLRPNVEVNRSYAEGLPQIEAFGSELNQVWTNILDNAIDAMNGVGVIDITTRVIGDFIEVELTDNGPGIPADAAAQIFDPFFTTKAPGDGTGLGLNISHNIVTEKHGGDISLTSVPGRTTFTIRLPITAPAGLGGDDEPARS